jgi:asparagine synthase (glutamine-hydrolysing)
MCGLIGNATANREARQISEQALRVLARRGPDSTGTWSSPNYCVGHTRLSILDLDPRSDQPMVSADGRYVMAFNGEIYNFRALRARLAAEGAHFVTAGDTEVLMQWVVTRGTDALADIRGMFAFALWDSEDRTLILGRDAFGIKPLLWAEQQDGIAFASTSDALVALGMPPHLDADYLGEYLEFGHGVLGSSPFSGVEALPPGCCLTWSADRIVRTRFADLRAEQARPTDWPTGRAEAFSVIRDSIVRHMVSDVPVGVFLSGGVDSSAVAGTMREAAQEVKSFSVSFSEAGYDESEAAQLAASRLGTSHRCVPFKLKDTSTLFDQLVRAYDEPFGDAAALPTLAVARIASEEVKVVLSGEGGDELFGGYRRYIWHRRSDRIPGVVRRLAAPAFGGVRERLKPLVGWSDYADGYINWLQYGFSISGGTRYAAALNRIRARQGPDNELWSLMVSDQTGWLVDTYLVKLDRATMWHSLEGRVPLLDLDVHSLARNLPDQARITRQRVGKNVLREYTARFVGWDHVNRPKHGFSVPIGAIMASGALSATMARLVSAASSAGPSARQIASVLTSLTTDQGELASTRWWYLLVLLGWCEARGLLPELDVLEGHPACSGLLTHLEGRR